MIPKQEHHGQVHRPGCRLTPPPTSVTHTDPLLPLRKLRLTSKDMSVEVTVEVTGELKTVGSQRANLATHTDKVRPLDSQGTATGRRDSGRGTEVMKLHYHQRIRQPTKEL